ncbi:hypothetical protein GGS20DRAFT_459809 [Poronia punctata]|nr:hypothetical protein GGS20DRAFT_459809 [Poronia punctata]
MAAHHPSMATLPKGFRYYDESGPKTPEPLATGEEELSAPPPRQRLRLKKRRHVSHLNAPTQQFLASIAAADVAIPSVEIFHVDHADQEMRDTLPELNVGDFDDVDGSHRLAPRMFSPPKTPAIEIAPSPTSTQYPDWYRDSTWSDSDLESNPDYESSRPSTAFSTQTSSSLFSMYSLNTDDGNYIDPDTEATQLSKEPEAESARTCSKEARRRKAPWTRAMSSHLWATYMLYLSDPRVTPLRLGKSSIPPHGVCARVARQAQRTWKGTKSQLTAEDIRSGSSTPTAGPARTYIQWPHTGGATRAHLRELCKIKATSKPGRYQSKSPTPFNKPANRRWNRRSTPARSNSVFSAQDLAMSLTLSTSDSMQPHGVLAQLTSSQPATALTCEYLPETDSSHDSGELGPAPVTPVKARPLQDPFTASVSQAHEELGRLGSPFFAKSYGPSSSSSAAVKLGLPQKPNTVGPRKLLKSPVRLGRSRSGTTKRRSTKGHEEKAWKRPSLAAAFFREGSRSAEDSTAVPTTNDQQTYQLEDASPTLIAAARGTSDSPLAALAASPSRPPRLGSPFSGAGSSYSFPNRFSSAGNFSLSAWRRPFATVQPSTQPTSDSPSTTRPTLASRLAYLDQRLKDFRHRRADRRRSQSPL